MLANAIFKKLSLLGLVSLSIRAGTIKFNLSEGEKKAEKGEKPKAEICQQPLPRRANPEGSPLFWGLS